MASSRRVKVGTGLCVGLSASCWGQAEEDGKEAMPERGHRAFLLCQQQPLFSWEIFPVMALAPVWECATMGSPIPSALLLVGAVGWETLL